MDDSDILGARRKALEETFFAKQNHRLLAELRAKRALAERKESLSAASGIRDDAVLEQLAELGLASETLAALSLAPLVEVAWADGGVDQREREAVLAAAEQVGIVKGEPSAQLLENWLEERPGSELHLAWKEYVEALSRQLSAEAAAALRQDLLGRARAVAEASGGLLGFGAKVSVSERAVLEELEKAFP